MTESQYREIWENYWSQTSDAPGEAIWDSDPQLTAVPHLRLLVPHVDATLPIVDLGCGSGTQTRYLAGHFPRAIGVDIAASAVAHAQRSDTAGVAEFEQLDAADTAAVRALRARTGDVNVYLRAVIHQSEPQDRARVAEAVAILTGARGRAFVVELTSAAKTVLREVVSAPGGPPPKIARVFEHGLKPGETRDGEVAELLTGAGLAILAEGDITLPQTEHRADGSRIDLPAHWFVLGRSD